MNHEVVSNVFLLNVFAYIYFTFSLVHRTTQTPAVVPLLKPQASDKRTSVNFDLWLLVPY